MEKTLRFVLEFLNKVSPRIGGLLGFHIFCYPIRPKMKAYQKQFLKESTIETLQVNGDKITLYKWGTGSKKVLLLHGWASHSYRWKEQIESFDLSEYSIYALDGPAHGLSSGYQTNIPSYGQAIHEVLLRIPGIETMIGHSFGGATGLYTLFQYGDHQVKKIAVMGSPGEASEFLRYYQKKLDLSDKTIQNINETIKRKIGQYMEYFSVERFAKSLDQEILIIHDKGDLEVPFENAVKLDRIASNTHLILTQGLGHKLRGPEIAKTLRAFLDGGIGSLNTQEKMLKKLV